MSKYSISVHLLSLGIFLVALILSYKLYNTTKVILQKNKLPGNYMIKYYKIFSKVGIYISLFLSLSCVVEIIKSLMSN